MSANPLAILKHPALTDYRSLARNAGCSPIAITEAQLAAASAALHMHSWRGFVDVAGPYLARACDPSTHGHDDDPIRDCIARDSLGRCWVLAAGDSVSDAEVLRRLDSLKGQP